MRDGNYLSLPFLKSQRLRRFAKVFFSGGAWPGAARPGTTTEKGMAA
jgi:hypothetical protein